MADPIATQELEENSTSQEERNKLIKSVKSNVDNLSVMSVEILTVSMDSHRCIADPAKDSIYAIFYALNLDACNINNEMISGGFILAKYCDTFKRCNEKIFLVPTESELFYNFGKIIQKYLFNKTKNSRQLTNSVLMFY